MKKCMSMHQPWASLLMAGIKKHEGRSWYTSHHIEDDFGLLPQPNQSIRMKWKWWRNSIELITMVSMEQFKRLVVQTKDKKTHLISLRRQIHWVSKAVSNGSTTGLCFSSSKSIHSTFKIVAELLNHHHFFRIVYHKKSIDRAIQMVNQKVHMFSFVQIHKNFPWNSQSVARTKYVSNHFGFN